jgi:hypothetical protein
MRERSGLQLYGRRSENSDLDWEWVEAQLVAAGTYWATAKTNGHPHPRPVWGIWKEGLLYLSIGTPTTLEALSSDPTLTVHLDSGTDVVIVEGHVVAPTTDPSIISDYDVKYDWQYDVDRYGPLWCMEPDVVLAWQAAGWAGRESFQRTGRWEWAARP